MAERSQNPKMVCILPDSLASIFDTMQALCYITNPNVKWRTLTCGFTSYSRHLDTCKASKKKPLDNKSAVTSSKVILVSIRTCDMSQKLQTVMHSEGNRASLSEALHSTSHLPVFGVTKFIFFPPLTTV